jgi:cell wall-associated NlpC family hydrolase
VDGLTEVLARIGQIQAQFGGATQTSTSTSGSVFADALSGANTALGSASANGLTDTSAYPSTDGLGGVGSTGAGGSASGSSVVADAQRYLGVPYVWGGTNPSVGLDCSGLVQRVYGDLGITLPRLASDQAKQGVAVPSLSAAQPGDLVTFGRPAEHIGIYIGNGMMINAPHTGTSVRTEAVGTPTSIRRIVGSTADTTGAAGAAPYAALFTQAAAKYGVPANLLAAVAQAESNFNPTAVSPAGAQGMMQIMPATAAGMGVNPMDPAQAIDGAARILAGNLRQFGSPALAVAAYNAGAGAVARYGGIPPYPETQAYVTKVLNFAGMSR